MKRASLWLLLVSWVGGCVVPERTATVPKGGMPSLKGRQVLVVGVVGMGHFVQKEYPLGVLGQFVSDFRPDLVVVQAPQAAVAAGRLAALGPIFSYVAWEAKNRHIPVMGLSGRPHRGDGARAHHGPRHGGPFRGLLREVLPKVALPPGFETAHSDVFQDAVLAVWPDALYRGCPHMGRMVGWVLRGVREAILAGSGRKVLVFVAMPVRPLLASYLKALGAEVVEPLAFWQGKGRSVAALAGRKVPAAVLGLWQAALRTIEGEGPGAFGSAKRRRFLEVAFQVALQVQGGCCLARKELKAKLKAVRTEGRAAGRGGPGRQGVGPQGTPGGPGSGQTGSSSAAGGAPAVQAGPSGGQGPGEGARPSGEPPGGTQSPRPGQKGGGAPGEQPQGEGSGAGTR